jgi:hypothetical protein
MNPSTLLSAIFVLVMGAGHAQPADAQSCDRGCLTALLDAYLTAVFENEPVGIRLSENHRATENAADFGLGEGPWRTVTGFGDIQRRFLDPTAAQAAYYGYLLEGDTPVIASVRIRIDAAGAVSEAEWTIARDGQFGLMNAAGLAEDPPPPDAPIPADRRSSRFMMQAIANGYFQALQDHDGERVPHFETCERVENGVKVTHRPRRRSPATPPKDGSGGAPTLAEEELSGDCVAGFEMFRDGIAETTMRRFPVIDEEAGVVMGNTIFRRPSGNTNRRNLLTEYFFVRDGRLTGIWAAMYYLDPDAPWSSGWENP